MQWLDRILSPVRRVLAWLGGERAVIAADPPQAAQGRRFVLPDGGNGLLPGTTISLAARAVQQAQTESLAPWPMTDRYPIIIGQNLSLQYFANVSRLALTGYRQQFVDLLDELLEYDPHAFSVLSQRILAVAGGRLEITPADCEEEDEEAAAEVADMVRARFCAIPDLKAHLASLLWAIYYATTASEIHYRRGEDGAWWVDHLTMVHSRRLGYPDAGVWDLHVIDQGMVSWGDFGNTPTTDRGVGLRILDYPGKFVVHQASVRGDYPTREGVGRQVGPWMLLKRVAARSATSYLERFAKPWPIATYATRDDGKPRSASVEDKQDAEAMLAAMGSGTLSGASIPDSVVLDLKCPTGETKLKYSEWINLVNSEISKAALTQTLTTEVGSTGGNRALGEVHERGGVKLSHYDADCLSETLRRDIAAPLVKLNKPGLERLTPKVTIHVEDEPSPDAVMKIAVMGAGIGMPLDADDLARRTGLRIVPVEDLDEGEEDEMGEHEEPKPRRLAVVKPVELSSIDSSIKAPPPPPPAPLAPNAVAPSDEESEDEDDETEQPEADDADDKSAAA